MRQTLQQLGASALFAIIALLLIVGGLATTLAETKIGQPPTHPITETSLPASVLPTAGIIATSVDLGLVSPTSFSASPTIPVPPTETLPPSIACPAPTGWESYIVQLGDNLDVLAQRYGISVTTLKEENCLVSDELLPDTRLHVPPYPTATPVPCGPPYNWTVSYYVKAGDNLYRIGLKYRVSVQQMQQANCLGYSTQIKVGQRLYVPNVATSTPVQTDTPTATATALVTATNTPSNTPTQSSSMTASPTTDAATQTSTPPSPTATFTPVPPTATATSLPEATATNPPEATATDTTAP